MVAMGNRQFDYMRPTFNYKMEEQAVVLEKESLSIDMKQRFDNELSKLRINAAKNSIFLNETTYRKLLNDVQKPK